MAGEELREDVAEVTGSSSSSLAAALADRYLIERELGAGGMATVYLARDLKHERHVAIKVLRQEIATAVGAERFQREIRLAASLQHPHILTVHDSGEAAGQLWYTMPYIDGESLRDRLDREKQLPIDDALQIAAQVADALSYAHGHNVVHRDIKPENILLQSGHSVVTDFGIAKAVGFAGAATLTETGTVVGTAQYMSPEQAAGEKELDGRSDLYSLACVLYEMLGGRPPFTGATTESMLFQHLTIVAQPITNLRPAVPATVVATLQRALAKAPADRFASVPLFADALGRVSAVGGSVVGGVVRPSRRQATIASLAVLVLLGGVAIALTARHPGPATILLGKRSQVTHESGLEIDPALSPDGKILAYSGAGGILFVRQVDGGDPIRVVRSADAAGRWPAWDRTGQRLVFLSPRGVEVVAALGGVPRLVAAEANPERGIALAPDGLAVAFVAHDSLFAKTVDGSAIRLITVGAQMHSPAWSPDGKRIAFVLGNTQYVSARDRSLGNLAPSSVHVVAANGGTSVQVTDEHYVNVSPAWTAAGDLLYVSDREGSRDVYQVKLSNSGVAAGVPVRLTTGLNVLGIGMSLDGSHLAYSSFAETSNVWSLPVTTGGLSVSQARPETEGNQTIENVDVSPDGQWLAYSSNVAGVTQVYRLHLGHGAAEPQQLTTDSVGSFWAAWSPDGKQIAFHSFHGDRRQIFVVPTDGGQSAAVTDGTEDTRSPEWSPDGQRLVMLANWGTHPTLRIIRRISGGRWSTPQQLPVVVGTDTLAAGLAVWSPDGKTLACACGPGGLVILPADGGPAHRLPSTFSTQGWAFPQWSADGRTLFHLTEDSTGVAAVVAVPISGARPYTVVRFDDQTRPWHRFGFRVRGARFYLTLGDQESDIWVANVGLVKP